MKLQNSYVRNRLEEERGDHCPCRVRPTDLASAWDVHHNHHCARRAGKTRIVQRREKGFEGRGVGVRVPIYFSFPRRQDRL
jgi:hypothetical protein